MKRDSGAAITRGAWVIVVGAALGALVLFGAFEFALLLWRHLAWR